MRISDWSSDVCSSDLRTGAGREHGVAAVAQQEGALQRGDRAIDRAGRGERAEIVPLAGARASVLGDLRVGVVAAHQDVRERLVVAQQYVEPGLPALDQVALAEQRLQLGVGEIWSASGRERGSQY